MYDRGATGSRRFADEAGPQPAGRVGLRSGTAVGDYRGMTEEPIPRRVFFRVVRGGVRDLSIGGVPMTDWLKIADGKANGLTSDGSAISLRWRDHGDVRGSLTSGDPGASPLRFRASLASG